MDDLATTATLEPTRHEILGLRLDLFEPGAAVARFMHLVRTGVRGYCCVANVHQCVLAHDDAAFRVRVNRAALVIADSTILQRAVALRTKLPFVPPLRGAELMREICCRAAAERVPIALVGGRDEAALDVLCDRLESEFPNLRIAFRRSPPYRPPTPNEEQSLLAGIRSSGARICFVGLGCPKQENWMAAHTGRIDAMLIGVGAAFDVNAGLARPSPPWVHRAGFEWLHRLLCEPRRLWRRYASTSPRFLWLLWRDARR
jgi:N-acetylglucosaminyldiphosphoundecaprenol N-acetyl-beta-D-mannosaminyltransferase